MEKERYSWNYNKDDEDWNHDICDTMAECMSEAKEDYGVEVGTTIAIGKVNKFEIEVDCRTLLEEIENDAMDKCGESGENIINLDEDQIAKLNKELTLVVENFLRVRKLEPNVYYLTNIKEVEVY